MIRTLITALAVVSLACVSSADAATKKKKRHVEPDAAVGAPVMAVPEHPGYAPTRGPIWANPNECFTDEGYGRYWPCGQGRD
jgi:hypothetical protein